jgi:redox-sensitive bicupin YhaK (pirin superfamily)
MSKNRSISNVLFAHEFDMGGLKVRQPFPSDDVRQVDPFILLHHARMTIPAGTDLANAGVGPHPHKGFSPVTFIFSGGVHHRDSRGHDSTIYAGGTQWMNAGAGIMHSERPPEDIVARGGEQEIIQMWVNTPAKYKGNEPKYIPLTKEATPSIELDNGNAELFLQAGEMFGTRGAIETQTPISAATLSMKAGAKVTLPAPSGHNAFLFLLDGKLSFGGREVTGDNAVIFANDGDEITFEAKEATRALFMSGEPINEPLAMYGPFVMNTRDELKQAFIEFQLGKMGVLED